MPTRLYPILGAPKYMREVAQDRLWWFLHSRLCSGHSHLWSQLRNYHQEPILPIKVLRLGTVSGASLTGGFVSTSVYIFMFYVPLYFQLLGFGTQETRLLLLPQSISSAISAFSAGLIMHLNREYSTSKIVVLGLYVTDAIGFSNCTATAHIISSEIYLFIVGFGYGGMLTVMLLALLSAVDSEDQAVNSCCTFCFPHDRCHTWRHAVEYGLPERVSIKFARKSHI